MTRENYAAERMYRTVRPGIRIREKSREECTGENEGKGR